MKSPIFYSSIPLSPPTMRRFYSLPNLVYWLAQVTYLRLRIWSLFEHEKLIRLTPIHEPINWCYITHSSYCPLYQCSCLWQICMQSSPSGCKIQGLRGALESICKLTVSENFPGPVWSFIFTPYSSVDSTHQYGLKIKLLTGPVKLFETVNLQMLSGAHWWVTMSQTHAPNRLK